MANTPTPPSSPEPAEPVAQTPNTPVTLPEFVSPPSNLSDALDADHDDDAIGHAAAPGLTHHELDVGELLFVSAEESSSFKEAEQHKRWWLVMIEEIESISSLMVHRQL